MVKNIPSVIINRIKESKEIKNAGWLIGGRVLQMVISLLVSILTARFLGPNNYGLINYAAAYVAFFTSLCTLGINGIIVKEFIDHPGEQGIAIGSTLVLRFVSSLLSAVTITIIVLFVDKGEATTISVVALSSIALLFQIFDTFNYWFQAKYQSKVTAIATLVAYLIVSAYKIILLVLKADVRWFAFASSVDFIFIAILLFSAYKRNKGPKLRFSIIKSKELLSQSYHYILSGLMVAIYGQTDKIMLKQMLGETEVGYYSIATAICTMWVFVLQAIIDSLFPSIVRLHSQGDTEGYKRKNRQLYAIVFYISVFVSIVLVLFGSVAIRILYGEAYIPAVQPLQIVTWYTAFSYLGVARNAWIVCEGKQNYLKYLCFCAAIVNILLNLAFIPILSASGAALASLITQVCTSIIIPLFIKDLRRNAVLMCEAITLRDLFEKKKQ